MKPYPKYKDSNNEWIGNIPEHWDIKRVKHIGKTIAGGTPSTDKPEYWENGNVLWMPSGKVQNNIITVNQIDKFITQRGLNESAAKLIKPNSVVIALTGATCGNIGLVTFETSANQSVVAIHNKKDLTYSTYLFYLLLSLRQHILINKTGGAQSGINEDDVKNILLHYPPLPEQQVIADFLDSKTAQIDDLISKKEKLIELLQEERTAVINHTVTKGINPNSEMKDSGIEWLGEIPSHWDIKKIGYLSNITKLTGFEYTNKWVTDEQGEIIALRGYNIGNGTLDLSSVERISMSLSNDLSRSKLFKNDIVYPYTGTIGNAYLIDENNKYHINQNIAKICSNKLVNPKYLLNSLLSFGVKSQIHYNNASQMQPVILIGDLRKIKIAIPLDHNEQIQLVTYIEKENNRINNLISTIQREIEMLQEYRTALISEAVTGKIDVRRENHE